MRASCRRIKAGNDNERSVKPQLKSNSQRTFCRLPRLVCSVEGTSIHCNVTVLSHGAQRLPSVEIVSYNVELKDGDGFVVDRASKGAFRHFIDEWRKPLRRLGEDPFGNE